MKSLIKRFVPTSIRGRLSVLFSIVFGVTLTVTSFVSFKVFTRTQMEEFDAFLYNHAVDVEARMASATDPAPVIGSDPTFEFKKHRLFSVKRTYLQLSDSTGKVLARSPGIGAKTLPEYPGDVQIALAQGVSYRTVQRIDFSQGEDAGKPYRLITYAVDRPQNTPLLLQIAAPLTLLERGDHEFLILLFYLIPCSVLVSGVLGYAVSRRAFSPVMRMAQKTSQIEMKSLKERIEVKESDAELKELGRTLNQLLERVENAVSAQERFVADASHQLKTPLAIVRGELELLQARPGHPPDVMTALRDMSQEVSQLIGLVENLLMLARMDAGLGRLPFQLIRLDELLSEAMTRLQYVAKRKGVRLTSELHTFDEQPEKNIDFEFWGDADLMRCLMENLIENAIKYSGGNGQVTAKLTEKADCYWLEVQDRGQGMSPGEVSAIFERFWRDPKKSTSVPGAGLGLAIAKKITEIHRGAISVDSRPGEGSTFSIRLSKT